MKSQPRKSNYDRWLLRQKEIFLKNLKRTTPEGEIAHFSELVCQDKNKRIKAISVALLLEVAKHYKESEEESARRIARKFIKFANSEPKHPMASIP